MQKMPLSSLSSLFTIASSTLFLLVLLVTIPANAVGLTTLTCSSTPMNGRSNSVVYKNQNLNNDILRFDDDVDDCYVLIQDCTDIHFIDFTNNARIRSSTIIIDGVHFRDNANRYGVSFNGNMMKFGAGQLPEITIANSTKKYASTDSTGNSVSFVRFNGDVQRMTSLVVHNNTIDVDLERGNANANLHFIYMKQQFQPEPGDNCDITLSSNVVVARLRGNSNIMAALVMVATMSVDFKDVRTVSFSRNIFSVDAEGGTGTGENVRVRYLTSVDNLMEARDFHFTDNELYANVSAGVPSVFFFMMLNRLEQVRSIHFNNTKMRATLVCSSPGNANADGRIAAGLFRNKNNPTLLNHAGGNGSFIISGADVVIRLFHANSKETNLGDRISLALFQNDIRGRSVADSLPFIFENIVFESECRAKRNCHTAHVAAFYNQLNKNVDFVKSLYAKNISIINSVAVAGEQAHLVPFRFHQPVLNLDSLEFHAVVITNASLTAATDTTNQNGVCVVAEFLNKVTDVGLIKFSGCSVECDMTVSKASPFLGIAKVDDTVSGIGTLELSDSAVSTRDGGNIKSGTGTSHSCNVFVLYLAKVATDIELLRLAGSNITVRHDDDTTYYVYVRALELTTGGLRQVRRVIVDSTTMRVYDTQYFRNAFVEPLGTRNTAQIDNIDSITVSGTVISEVWISSPVQAVGFVHVGAIFIQPGTSNINDIGNITVDGLEVRKVYIEGNCPMRLSSIEIFNQAVSLGNNVSRITVANVFFDGASGIEIKTNNNPASAANIGVIGGIYATTTFNDVGLIFFSNISIGGALRAQPASAASASSAVVVTVTAASSTMDALVGVMPIGSTFTGCGKNGGIVAAGIFVSANISSGAGKADGTVISTGEMTNGFTGDINVSDAHVALHSLTTKTSSARMSIIELGGAVTDMSGPGGVRLSGFSIHVGDADAGTSTSGSAVRVSMIRFSDTITNIQSGDIIAEDGSVELVHLHADGSGGLFKFIGIHLVKGTDTVGGIIAVRNVSAAVHKAVQGGGAANTGMVTLMLLRGSEDVKKIGGGFAVVDSSLVAKQLSAPEKIYVRGLYLFEVAAPQKYTLSGPLRVIGTTVSVDQAVVTNAGLSSGVVRAFLLDLGLPLTTIGAATPAIRQKLPELFDASHICGINATVCVLNSTVTLHNADCRAIRTSGVNSYGDISDLSRDGGSGIVVERLTVSAFNWTSRVGSDIITISAVSFVNPISFSNTLMRVSDHTTVNVGNISARGELRIKGLDLVEAATTPSSIVTSNMFINILGDATSSLAPVYVLGVYVEKGITTGNKDFRAMGVRLAIGDNVRVISAIKHVHVCGVYLASTTAPAPTRSLLFVNVSIALGEGSLVAAQGGDAGDTSTASAEISGVNVRHPITGVLGATPGSALYHEGFSPCYQCSVTSGAGSRVFAYLWVNVAVALLQETVSNFVQAGSNTVFFSHNNVTVAGALVSRTSTVTAGGLLLWKSLTDVRSDLTLKSNSMYVHNATAERSAEVLGGSNAEAASHVLMQAVLQVNGDTRNVDGTILVQKSTLKFDHLVSVNDSVHVTAVFFLTALNDTRRLVVDDVDFTAVAAGGEMRAAWGEPTKYAAISVVKSHAVISNISGGIELTNINLLIEKNSRVSGYKFHAVVFHVEGTYCVSCGFSLVDVPNVTASNWRSEFLGTISAGDGGVAVYLVQAYKRWARIDNLVAENFTQLVEHSEATKSTVIFFPISLVYAISDVGNKILYRNFLLDVRNATVTNATSTGEGVAFTAFSFGSSALTENVNKIEAANISVRVGRVRSRSLWMRPVHLRGELRRVGDVVIDGVSVVAEDIETEFVLYFAAVYFNFDLGTSADVVMTQTTSTSTSGAKSTGSIRVRDIFVRAPRLVATSVTGAEISVDVVLFDRMAAGSRAIGNFPGVLSITDAVVDEIGVRNEQINGHPAVNFFRSNCLLENISEIEISNVSLRNVHTLDGSIDKPCSVAVAKLVQNVSNVSSLVVRDNELVDPPVGNDNTTGVVKVLRFDGWLHALPGVESGGEGVFATRDMKLAVVNNSIRFTNKTRIARLQALTSSSFGENSPLNVVDVRGLHPAVSFIDANGDIVDARDPTAALSGSSGGYDVTFRANVLEIPFGFMGRADFFKYSGERYGPAQIAAFRSGAPTTPSVLFERNQLRQAFEADATDTTCSPTHCALLTLRRAKASTSSPVVVTYFFGNYTFLANRVERGVASAFVTITAVNGTSGSSQTPMHFTSSTRFYFKDNVASRHGTIVLFRSNESDAEPHRVALPRTGTAVTSSLAGSAWHFACSNWWPLSFQRLFQRDYAPSSSAVTFDLCQKYLAATRSASLSATPSQFGTLSPSPPASASPSRSRSATGTESTSPSSASATSSATLSRSATQLLPPRTRTPTLLEVPRTRTATHSTSAAPTSSPTLSRSATQLVPPRTRTPTLSRTFALSLSPQRDTASVQPTATRTPRFRTVTPLPPPPVKPVAAADEPSQGSVDAVATTSAIGTALGSTVAVRSLSVLSLGTRLCDGDEARALPPPSLFWPQNVLGAAFMLGAPDNATAKRIIGNKTLLNELSLPAQRALVIVHRALPQHLGAVIAGCFIMPVVVALGMMGLFFLLQLSRRKGGYCDWPAIARRASLLARLVQALAFASEGIFASAIYLTFEPLAPAGHRVAGVFCFLLAVSTFGGALYVVRQRLVRRKLEFVKAMMQCKKKKKKRRGDAAEQEAGLLPGGDGGGGDGDDGLEDPQELTTFWRFILGDGVWTQNDAEQQLAKREARERQQQQQQHEGDEMSQLENRNVENQQQQQQDQQPAAASNHGFSDMFAPLHRKFGVYPENEEARRDPGAFFRVRRATAPYFFFIEIVFTLLMAIFRGGALAAPCSWPAWITSALIISVIALIAICVIRPLSSPARMLCESVGSFLVVVAILQLVSGRGGKKTENLVIAGTTLAGGGIFVCTLLIVYKEKILHHMLVPARDVKRSTVLVDLLANLRIDGDDDFENDVMAFLNEAPAAAPVADAELPPAAQEAAAADNIEIDLGVLDDAPADDVELEEQEAPPEPDPAASAVPIEMYDVWGELEGEEAEAEEEEAEDDEGGEAAQQQEEDEAQQPEREDFQQRLRAADGGYVGDRAGATQRLLDNLEMEVDGDVLESQKQRRAAAEAAANRQRAQSAQDLQRIMRDMRDV